jgi:DNA-binding GntR family transcriptional regulator
MPVRVGLKRLESDGALTSKNKGSFLVSDPDQEEFQDILRIRLVLECFAIREAALRATVGDLPALHRLNEEYHRLLRAGKDGARKSLIPNFNFHFRIYELAGSPNLVDLIGRLWLRIGPTLQRYVGGNAVVHTDFHGSMLDGLVRNDPEIAAAALTDDLTTAASAIIPLLRPRAESTKITLDGGGDE